MIPDIMCGVIRYPDTFLMYPSAQGSILRSRLEFGIKPREMKG